MQFGADVQLLLQNTQVAHSHEERLTVAIYRPRRSLRGRKILCVGCEHFCMSRRCPEITFEQYLTR